MKKWFLSLVLVLSLFGAVYAQDTPTPDPAIDVIIAASEPIVIQTYPVANYTATVTLYPCTDVNGEEMAYERLDVTNLATNETRKAAEQLRYCQGLGAIGLSILRFASSPEGEFLFYTDAREGQPDGLAVGWVRPVLRVNLADFSVESVGQAKFSLTGEELVTWDQTQIRVVSVSGAERAAFPLTPAGMQIVEVTWLPLNSGVIYVQSDFFMGGSRNTVTHLDLETMEQTVILDTSAE